MAIAICKNCSVEFLVKPYTKGLYCSRMCYHKDMVGKIGNIVHRKTFVAWNKGLKLPNQSGVNHPRWIKDRTLLATLSNGEEYRNSPASRDWAKRVKNRDSWKCRIADTNCNGKLVAHHILPWSKFPELRYDINNGITLCRFHHPLKRSDEMKLSQFFQELVVSNRK